MQKMRSSPKPGDPEENQLIMSSQEQSGNDDSHSEEENEADSGSVDEQMSYNDSLSEIEDYSDVLIDIDVLAKAYDNCTIGRIKKEREFQASYYIMSKYLRKGESNQKV